MIVAYVRVSTDKQNLTNQSKEIKRFAQLRKIKVDQWEEEVVSGTVDKKDRLLEDVVGRLGKGDTLIVTEISRLSRSLLEIITIMQDCINRGINVLSIKDGYTFDNSLSSKALMLVFGFVAEYERNLISSRTCEALANLKARGVKLGRPLGSSPKLNLLIKNKQKVEELLRNGISIREICLKFGIGRSTYDVFRKKYLDSDCA